MVWKEGDEGAWTGTGGQGGGRRGMEGVECAWRVTSVHGGRRVCMEVPGRPRRPPCGLDGAEAASNENEAHGHREGGRRSVDLSRTVRTGHEADLRIRHGYKPRGQVDSAHGA